MDLSQLQHEIESNMEIKRLLIKLNVYSNLDGLSPLLITSAVDGEGKTSLAIVFAISLSRELNKKCLLIDANWDRPKLHHKFKTNNDFSITKLLSEPENCISKTPFDNMDVLNAPGEIDIDIQQERTLNDNLKPVYSKLCDGYDLVLIDSQAIFSPKKSLVDPLYMATFAQCIIMTIMMHKTERHIVKRASISLGLVNKNISVIMNNFQNPMYS